MQRNKHFQHKQVLLYEKDVDNRKDVENRNQMKQLKFFRETSDQKMLKIVCSEFTTSYRARVKTRKLQMENVRKISDEF